MRCLETTSKTLSAISYAASLARRSYKDRFLWQKGAAGGLVGHNRPHASSCEGATGGDALSARGRRGKGQHRQAFLANFQRRL